MSPTAPLSVPWVYPYSMICLSVQCDPFIRTMVTTICSTICIPSYSAVLVCTALRCLGAHKGPGIRQNAYTASNLPSHSSSSSDGTVTAKVHSAAGGGSNGLLLYGGEGFILDSPTKKHKRRKMDDGDFQDVWRFDLNNKSWSHIHGPAGIEADTVFGAKGQ